MNIGRLTSTILASTIRLNTLLVSSPPTGKLQDKASSSVQLGARAIHNNASEGSTPKYFARFAALLAAFRAVERRSISSNDIFSEVGSWSVMYMLLGHYSEIEPL